MTDGGESPDSESARPRTICPSQPPSPDDVFTTCDFFLPTDADERASAAGRGRLGPQLPNVPVTLRQRPTSPGNRRRVFSECLPSTTHRDDDDDEMGAAGGAPRERSNSLPPSMLSQLYGRELRRIADDFHEERLRLRASRQQRVHHSRSFPGAQGISMWQALLQRVPWPRRLSFFSPAPPVLERTEEEDEEQVEQEEQEREEEEH